MGFPLDSFTERVPPPLICRLCDCVFQDPVGLPCGHMFCRSCLNKSLLESTSPTCPVCNAFVDRSQCVKVNELVLDLLGDLKTACSKCLWRGTLHSYAEHVAKGCASERCAYHRFGCEIVGTRIDIDQHEQNHAADHLKLVMATVDAIQTQLKPDADFCTNGVRSSLTWTVGKFVELEPNVTHLGRAFTVGHMPFQPAIFKQTVGERSGMLRLMVRMLPGDHIEWLSHVTRTIAMCVRVHRIQASGSLTLRRQLPLAHFIRDYEIGQVPLGTLLDDGFLSPSGALRLRIQVDTGIDVFDMM
ncbi:RING-type domain-containing protein [Plasmodiophora brassicae]|uniref:RING-type domain-containing protein n=1 Tax=Plasmodiophora brassicae TaxID=37360 RepID=A0A3P3Y844_PLABS|nr:unnamed protein product [Plasmodiophora brassicae]